MYLEMTSRWVYGPSRPTVSQNLSNSPFTTWPHLTPGGIIGHDNILGLQLSIPPQTLWLGYQLSHNQPTAAFSIKHP